MTQEEEDYLLWVEEQDRINRERTILDEMAYMDWLLETETKL
jgi:hypothetical protein